MALHLLHYADLEVAHDDPDQIGKLSGLINELRTSETIVCGSGDNIGPGVLSMISQGRQSLDFFRAVEADFDTFGNHDFDHGIEPLLDVVEDSPQTWACANAVFDENRFGSNRGVIPWKVIEKGDDKIGMIGVSHPNTAEINPNASPVEFSDPIPAVESAVNELREKEVDWIVVLSHLGEDSQLARQTDVDVILGGHYHDPLVEHIEGTLICRPGGTARNLLEVCVNEQAEATLHDIPNAATDTTLTSKLRERREVEGLDKIVGVVEEPIICDMMACKRGESRIGNLITDAFRWKTDAEIAITSGGGFRRRPPLSGEVTAFDLVSVIPYRNNLLVVELEGTELKRTLRDLSLHDSPADTPDWDFGHISGGSLVWDDAVGELRSAKIDNLPVKPDQTYELATTEFNINNNELFPALKSGDVVRNGGLIHEAVIEYAETVDQYPNTTGRINRPALNESDIPERDWPHSP